MEVFTNFIDFIIEWYPYFIKGTFVTLYISFIGLIFGIILGLVFGIMRVSKNKIIKNISTAYVEFIRATPLTVILMVFYYGFSSIIPDNLSFLKNVHILSICAISMNSSAIVAEVIRGGIQSVDAGQIEAGKSLGLNDKQIMKEIILPQAILLIIPSLLNSFIALVKDSSIVAFVGIKDITFQSKYIAGITYRYFSPYIIAGIIYFGINYSLSKLLKSLERRFQID